MDNRLLLYIDILGFSDMVLDNSEKIDELYRVIASLTVHSHYAFRCVIFSDTIVVYNTVGGNTDSDLRYLLMYECEFAKDLLHRLTGTGIFFRAVITKGYFRHYEINEVPCFYGASLLEAYQSEKKIKAIGLFVKKDLTRYCNIFDYNFYNENFSFVYMTQSLDGIESLCDGEVVNIKGCSEEEIFWSSHQDLLYLADLYKGVNSDISSDIKLKYSNTINLYKINYPNLMRCIENCNLNMQSVMPTVKWGLVLGRYPEDYSYAVKSSKEY